MGKTILTMTDSGLIKKYDVPTPRYTSYPTVPFWDETSFTTEAWKERLTATFIQSNNTEGISIYIHLPFCEQLCTYCGCNKRITTNHNVEGKYIETLLKEWELYSELLPEKPQISEIHLGGGTPTFFSPENLKKLIEGILSRSEKKKDFKGSVEVHPNYTKKDHLQVLYDCGFKRLSIGIQDFDPKVQFLINRPQTFERTKTVFEQAREIGYDSINADIIYGLPGQTQDSVELTIEKIKLLRPERIAFYSYAHVPWKSKSQRRYTESDLPAAGIKRNLYEYGKNQLTDAGYHELGMDHFVLPGDELEVAMNNKTLHRNFMGYTVQKSALLIGLGASSIGDTWTSFAQNIKEVEEYQEAVNEGRFPVCKGHILTGRDLFMRKHILNLMCNFETAVTLADLKINDFTEGLERLKELENDGLVIIQPDKIVVTETGRAFVRNICLCFDTRYHQQEISGRLFSRSV
jgi:oxygen-independent coproporphyrinogen III oxidase